MWSNLSRRVLGMSWLPWMFGDLLKALTILADSLDQYWIVLSCFNVLCFAEGHLRSLCNIFLGGVCRTQKNTVTVKTFHPDSLTLRVTVLRISPI